MGEGRGCGGEWVGVRSEGVGDGVLRVTVGVMVVSESE